MRQIMRLFSGLAFVGLMVLADNASATMATANYDEHTVMITTLGGKKYHIPSEYLGHGTPVSDVSIGLLVRATLPDFTIPPKEYGKGEAGIYIRDVSDTPNRLMTRYEEDLKNLSPMKRQDDVFDLQHYKTAKGPFVNFGLQEEYYIDNNTTPTILIECGTEKVAKDPQCQAIFVEGNLMYTLFFAKSYLADWPRMRTKSIQLINGFVQS